MVFTVNWRGQVVGTVNVTEAESKITFEVCCIQDTREILRCYGQNKLGGKPLLIGVLEPQDGALWAKRTFTKFSLEQACGEIPDTYYIYANDEKETEPPKEKIKTGDPLLDKVLAEGLVRAEKKEKGIRLSCAFAPEKPFPLVFAGAACHLEKENGRYFAVLEI